MGNSKVVYNGETLIDISGDSVTPETLLQGTTAHNSNGEQIVGTMNPEGGGSIVTQKQTDYNQNDETAVDFIKNRPFYEKTFSTVYKQSENPNPVSFNFNELNYSFHKISDLVLTKEDVLLKTSVIFNGTSYKPKEDEITLETDDFVMIAISNTYDMCFITKAGTIQFTFMGMQFELDVPETGVYFLRGLNISVPEGTVVEISCSDIKKIDTKFLPSIAKGDNTIDVLEDDMVDVIVNDETGNEMFVMVTDEKANELYTAILNNVPFALRFDIFGNGFMTILQHMGAGGFFIFDAGLFLTVNYDQNEKGLLLKIIDFASTESTASTYGLRRTTESRVYAFFEMLNESARERGLI